MAKVHLAQEPVCTAGYGLKKKLYASCFSTQTHKRCSSRAHCHYRWQHHPMGVSTTEEWGHPGLRGVWEAGGGLFELYGFMDGWIHGCEGKRMHGWIARRGMTMEREGKACRICRKWAHGALGWTPHRLVGNYQACVCLPRLDLRAQTAAVTDTHTAVGGEMCRDQTSLYLRMEI